VSAVRAGLLAIVLAACASAHVGSPDVYFQGKAGPYPLLVVVRPPNVIPGTASIEVRALDPGVRSVEITPTPMTGFAARHPPVADIAEQSKTDPLYFTGTLWLMSTGSWEIHVRAAGASGSGELLVPVPALALKTQAMQQGVGIFLLGMLVFLGVGLVAIVGAAVRESRLEPGVQPTPWNRRSLAWMAFTAALLILVVWGGKAWWADDASENAKKIYKPLGISASVEGANQLEVRLQDPGWLPIRRLDDIIPDHGHLMHLFLVRWPAMDVFFHLHPDQNAPGLFSLASPSLPAGRYRIYGDIVHDNGLAETAVGEIDLPAVTGAPLQGDDAGGVMSGANGMVWLRDDAKPIVAKQANLFRFELSGPDGPEELEPYMGMGGHAEFISLDGSVFAHVHPTGTVPMASVAVASLQGMMAMHQTEIGKVVSFPYGLPAPGRYKVFVQLKRGTVRTGVFDLTVE
jgi:hypothetical protein